jgi:hypothetical protein
MSETPAVALQARDVVVIVVGSMVAVLCLVVVVGCVLWSAAWLVDWIQHWQWPDWVTERR